MIKITIVAENTAARAGVLGEHGLSFWIETPAARLLFDAGPALSFRHNAGALGIPLGRADAVVLSHGHDDHTGGLSWALPRMPDAKIFLHPDALQPRFSLRGQAHPIGMPADARGALKARASSLVWTARPAKIAAGIHVTGAIPRKSELEDTGGPFFLDAGGTQPDPISDDQALWLETPSGLIVVLGCAHAGVINTVEYIRSMAPGRPVRALLGGMHLGAASPDRLDWTVKALQKLLPRQLSPMHCTGLPAVAALWQALPGRCLAGGAGVCFEFSDSLK